MWREEGDGRERKCVGKEMKKGEGWRREGLKRVIVWG